MFRERSARFRERSATQCSQSLASRSPQPKVVCFVDFLQHKGLDDIAGMHIDRDDRDDLSQKERLFQQLADRYVSLLSVYNTQPIGISWG